MLERKEVNVYIEQSVKGPQKEDGLFGYVLEYRKKSGDLETKEEYVAVEQMTAHETELTAIIKAIARMKEPCVVIVHSGHGYFKTAFVNHWLKLWEKENWKTKRGSEVRYKEKWCEILNIMKKHMIVLGEKEHGYKENLIDQIKKRKQEETKYV